MKKKIIIIIYIILVIITLKLLYNSAANSIFVIQYKNGEYSEKIPEQLTLFNFPEGYIANYNYGNVLYQNGDYENAIEQYKKALTCKFIPENRECSIRINYALAICKTVKLDESSKESIKEAINIYESAIDILTENGCANKEDDNGHSENAEKLKKDIQKEIERLKKLLEENEQENNNKNNEEEKQQEKNEENGKEEQVEEKIQRIKEEAAKEQSEAEQRYNPLFKDYNRNGKNW